MVRNAAIRHGGSFPLGSTLYPVGVNFSVFSQSATAGLIEKIPYLADLGVAAVELLPVFHCDAQDDAPPGRVNYWGYCPVSFCAHHQGYSSRHDPLGPLDECRSR